MTFFDENFSHMLGALAEFDHIKDTQPGEDGLFEAPLIPCATWLSTRTWLPPCL